MLNEMKHRVNNLKNGVRTGPGYRQSTSSSPVYNQQPSYQGSDPVNMQYNQPQQQVQPSIPRQNTVPIPHHQVTLPLELRQPVSLSEINPELTPMPQPVRQARKELVNILITFQRLFN